MSTTSGRRSSRPPRAGPRTLVLLSAGFDAMAGDPLGELHPPGGGLRRSYPEAPDPAASGTDRRHCSRAATSPVAWPRAWRPVSARWPDRSSRRRYLPSPQSCPEAAVTHRLRLEAEVLELRTRHPFIIARGGNSDYRTVMVRLIDQDGLEGWGEAAPTSYLRRDDRDGPRRARGVRDHSCRMIPSTSRTPSRRGKRASRATLRRGPPSPRRCTTWPGSAWACRSTGCGDSIPPGPEIDLHDRHRHRREDPEQGARGQAVSDPQDQARLGSRPGDPQDHPRRDRQGTPGGRQHRLDRAHAIRMLPVLEEFGVTVLEQPVVAADLDGLAPRSGGSPGFRSSPTRAARPRPTFPPLVGKVDGINIKLAKCGSLREAIRMIAIARAHNLMVMVGCMIESSLAITAAAHFTPLVDIVDLDGAALLANDPDGRRDDRRRAGPPSHRGRGSASRGDDHLRPGGAAAAPGPALLLPDSGGDRRPDRCRAPGSSFRCGSARWSASWSATSRRRSRRGARHPRRARCRTRTLRGAAGNRPLDLRLLRLADRPHPQGDAPLGALGRIDA